jgi:hypothetical protein
VGASVSPGEILFQINDIPGNISSVTVTSLNSSLELTPGISPLGPLTAPDLPDTSLPNLFFKDTSDVTITATAETGPVALFSFTFETSGAPVAPGFYVAAQTTNAAGESVISSGFAIVVPEPSPIVLLLTGLPVAALWVRVRRRAA